MDRPLHTQSPLYGLSPLQMGGTPKPPSCARGGCHLFEWGDPPTPPPAPVVDVASSNGGDPPNPPTATFLAIPVGPKHLSCHSRYVKTLYLVTPGHTWQHLVTTWQHLVTTWQHLVTPGNTWSPVTGDTRTQTGVSIVKAPMKFEFPALFSAKPWPTGPVPEINVNWHGTDHP